MLNLCIEIFIFKYLEKQKYARITDEIKEMILKLIIEQNMDKMDRVKPNTKWTKVQNMLKEAGQSFSKEQLQNIWKTEKAKFRKFKNPPSGAGRIDYQFGALLEDYMGDDPNIIPKVTVQSLSKGNQNVQGIYLKIFDVNSSLTMPNQLPNFFIFSNYH